MSESRLSEFVRILIRYHKQKLPTLSSTEILQPTEDRCRDSVQVSEGSKVILARCGDTNKPLNVVSEGPSLNVTLTASDHVFPKRGYVAHYKGEAGERSDHRERDVRVKAKVRRLEAVSNALIFGISLCRYKLQYPWCVQQTKPVWASRASHQQTCRINASGGT